VLPEKGKRGEGEGHMALIFLICYPAAEQLAVRPRLLPLITIVSMAIGAKYTRS